MATLLVIESSEVDRREMQQLVNREGGHELLVADHAAFAFEQIERHLPALVMIEPILPDMTATEFVRTVGSRFPSVPVLLMPAGGDEGFAIDALRSGAISYVHKSQLAKRLPETIERVLNRVSANRSRERLIRCLAAIGCFFSLENDLELIPPLVDMVQEILTEMGVGCATERLRIGLALEESLLNALIHGNLEITSEELATTTGNSAEERQRVLVDQRRRRAPFCERKIIVNSNMSMFGVRFSVRDDGPGFDYRAVFHHELTENLKRGRNRGLTLIHSIMDEVDYNDQGNEITMIHHVRKEDPSISQRTNSAGHPTMVQGE